MTWDEFYIMSSYTKLGWLESRKGMVDMERYVPTVRRLIVGGLLTAALFATLFGLVSVAVAPVIALLSPTLTSFAPVIIGLSVFAILVTKDGQLAVVSVGKGLTKLARQVATGDYGYVGRWFVGGVLAALTLPLIIWALGFAITPLIALLSVKVAGAVKLLVPAGVVWALVSDFGRNAVLDTVDGGLDLVNKVAGNDE